MKVNPIQKSEINTILVPTDFSLPAKNALEYAIAISKKSGAKIILMHIYQVPITTGRGVPFGVHAEVALRNSEFAENQFRILEAETQSLKGITYETKAVPGYWSIEFPEILEAQNADLIIMGSTGKNGFVEAISGSNTSRVIADVIRPVILVPGDSSYKEIKQIGFAYDNENINENVVSQLTTMALLFSASIRVFHINNREQKDQKIETVSNESLRNQFGDINFSYTSMYEDDLVNGINNFIQDQEIDLLAMVPRKHNLIYNLFNSSLTKKMAYRSKVPLLTLHE